MSPELSERWKIILDDCEGLSLDGMNKAALLQRAENIPDAITAGELAALLRDIRMSFPANAAARLQRGVLSSPAAAAKVMSPKVLECALPDWSLAQMLLSRRLPEKSRNEAAAVFEAVTAQITREIKAALTGGHSGGRSKKPDWPKTVRKSIGSYDSAKRRISAPRLVYLRLGRPKIPQKLIVLADRSSSMAGQSLWAVAACSVLASLPFLAVNLIAFTDAATDLTNYIGNPALCLLSLPAAGGTDMSCALELAESYISSPGKTMIILMSDFFDGVSTANALSRLKSMMRSGVKAAAICAAAADGSAAHNADAVAELCAGGMTFFSPGMYNWIQCISECIDMAAK